MKLVVHLDGGIVQHAFIVPENKIPLSLIIIDTDTEDCQDDNRLTKTRNKGKKIDAYIHEAILDKLEPGCDIDKLLKKYLKENKE